MVKAQIARSAHLLALIDVHLALIEHCICCNSSKLINEKSSKTSGFSIGFSCKILQEFHGHMQENGYLSADETT